MSHMPGFRAAEAAWENKEAYPEVDQCEDGDCDECVECLAAIAQDQADAYAEGQWEDWRAGR
jgi:hypothetical protein